MPSFTNQAVLSLMHFAGSFLISSRPIREKCLLTATRSKS